MTGQRKTGSRVGDLIEVQTPAGLGYLQYTHEESGMGSLVRVLPGLYVRRPIDIAKIANERELYFTFYTLRLALRKRDAKVVANQPVPSWAQPWPLMRSSNGEDRCGKTVSWKILPANTPFTLEELKKAPNCNQLAPDEERLSMRELWSHQLLVERMAAGWTPERAEEFRLRSVREESKTRTSEAPASEELSHYIYFPSKTKAQEAAKKLRDSGFVVEVRPSADGKNWLTLAKHTAPSDEEAIEQLRGRLEDLATSLDGDYDGWEMAADADVAPKPN